MKNLKNNKTQISIFVIIGVLIIFVVGFFIFNSDFKIFETKSSKYKGEVSKRVEECVEDFGKNGAFLLGFQAGYIDFPKSEKNFFDFENSQKNSLKIPNWDSEKGQIPTLETMEVELENYIKNQSFSCIENNLQTLSSEFKFDEILIDDLKIDVIFNLDTIKISSILPITFQEISSEQSFSTNSYEVILENYPLKKLYIIATGIFNFEVESSFLEDLVLDQIYSANNYGDENSMPSEGFAFSCRRYVWTKEQLKNTLSNLNNHNFKFLHFKGLEEPNYDLYFNSGALNLKKYYLNHYTFDIGFENLDVKLDVNFPQTQFVEESGYFQKYPFRTFDVNPQNNEIVKSLKAKLPKFKIPIPCVQYHHPFIHT